MGSAVDKENLTRRLEEFSKAGMGGVEITPIYGVKGSEDRFLQHLSPQWMEMLIHTLDEAERLGLGVDMVQGTGWPFGGPQVEPDLAAGRIFYRTYALKKGKKMDQQMTIDDPGARVPARLQHLWAFDKNGRKKALDSLVVKGKLEWTPDHDYDLYAIFRGWTGQQVKRAAPGGEGFVMDHFSGDALADYLVPYDSALVPVQERLRALFNDSYEVYRADYTPRFFEEFRERRGYDLSDQLPLLIPEVSGEDALRVLSDYRETVSDLLLEEFALKWSSWSRERSFKTKYQAHGSPGNLLDIYASADIPECESFKGTLFNIPGVRWEASDALVADPDFIMLKFASSAAHISGKQLTSSESLTWLREHFKTALSQCKPEIEQLLLSGVNHLFFHGSTYFPDDADWPGWKFYASVNFTPNTTIWNDAPSMFDYITRCQSMLQSGRSDNEILVYWPFHDVIGDKHDGDLLLQLSIHSKDEWLVPTSFYQLVSSLIEQGYSVDFISDRYLEEAEADDGKITLSGQEYDALVIPSSERMSVGSFRTMANLSRAGGRVIFEGIPVTVPGFFRYREREKQLKELTAETKKDLVVTRNIPEVLSEAGIHGEALKRFGLDFLRRDLDDGKIYYLVNHTPHTVDGYIPLNCRAGSVWIMDPETGKTGLGKLRSGKEKSRSGKSASEIYLQMKPGETLFLHTSDQAGAGPEWPYYEEAGDPLEIAGSWELDFVSGGPSIPERAAISELGSWTDLGPKAEAFSGTARYTITFDHPDPETTHWQLDLGDVRESARVRINGEDIGCLWSVPFATVISLPGNGPVTLEIEVTNLSANRLRDLERSGMEWKIFHEINMVNRHYERFDATAWEPMPSGLLGSVTLTPLRKKTVD
jgi:hypothetical protein